MTNSENPLAKRSQAELTQALLCLMSKHPYSEITVKQITLEARLARKTFYRNFESKDDVLLSLINGTLLEYFEAVNNARGDVMTTIFAFADKNRELLMLLDKNDLLHLPLQCLNELSPMILKNQNRQLNPFAKLFDGLDTGYLIALNVGAIWNVISLWVHREMADPPESVKQTLQQYLQRTRQMAPSLK